MPPLQFDKERGLIVYQDASGQLVPADVRMNPATKERIAFDGERWVTIPIPGKSLGEFASDVGRATAQGMTLGWADEASAGIDAALGYGSYEQNLAEEKKRTAAIDPRLRLTGEVAGAVAAPGLIPAKIAGAVARLPGVVRNPVLGAATGAIQGAGQAQPGERSEGAVTGGLVGAGAASVLAPAVRAAQSLATPQRSAAFDLHRAFASDKKTPEQAIAELADLRKIRPEATLADVGDQNVLGLVERVAQSPGGGRVDIFASMEQRQRGQLARIAADLRGLTGTTRSAIDATTDTIAARQAAADPLYKDAFNFNATQSPEIVRAWQNATRTGYGKAILNSDDYKLRLQTDYGIENAADAPLMVQIDAWKKVSDDFVGKFKRDGEAGKAGSITNMKNTVINVVDKYNPKYGEARGAWETDSKYLEALESGRSILTRDLDPQQFAKDYARMSDYEKEAHRIGAVSFILGRMGGDPAKLADLTKYLRAPNVKQNLAVLMPDDAARASWTQRFDYETRSSELVGQSLRGSPTARRMAEMKQADDMMNDLVIDLLTGAPAVGILRRAVGATQRATGGTVRTRADAALARTLTTPQSMDELAAAMERAGRAGPAAGRLPAQAAGVGAAAAPFLGPERDQY